MYTDDWGQRAAACILTNEARDENPEWLFEPWAVLVILQTGHIHLRCFLPYIQFRISLNKTTVYFHAFQYKIWLFCSFRWALMKRILLNDVIKIWTTKMWCAFYVNFICCNILPNKAFFGRILTVNFYVSKNMKTSYENVFSN